MANEPFLARTEEQDKFKQVLDLLLPPVQTQADKPFVYLLYGEGGMGKTRLTQRLREITETWQPYQGEFNVLFIDWEVERDNHPDLQVGHDSIHPEAVLNVIHDAFDQRGWGRHFQRYRETAETLKKAEVTIEKELQSKPENELYAQLRRIGSKPIATLIRKNIPVVGELIPQDSLEEGISVAAQLGANLASQARNLVQEKLTPHEYEVYKEPHTQLARALGRSIAALARTKPLVIFLDTYEVVDRMECDYALRQAIIDSSARVVWVIAGRANLADSMGRGNRYFRGYKNDFPDDRIYAKAMSEFGRQDVKEYFQSVIPERPITEDQAMKVAEFTLGIPFAVREAAAMWGEGATLEKIVEPIPLSEGALTAHQRVVNAMSERFLKHCIHTDVRDLRAVYALALVRRPEHDLLCAMLGADSLSQELQSLRDRYSFILVDEMRLEEKLSTFLQEYLLAPVRRTDPPVPELTAKAVDFLQERLERWTSDLASAEERLGVERVRETLADLAHHKFWQDEDTGWRYLIPRFVEGMEYDAAWARALLEIASTFRATFFEEGKRRLTTLLSGLGSGRFAIYAGIDGRKQMLDQIGRLARRGWLKGEGENERAAILLLERGRLLYREEGYKDALRLYLEAEVNMSENMEHLQAELADVFREVGFELGWERGDAIASAEARTAFEHAVALDAEDAKAHYGLGAMCSRFVEYEDAIAEFKRAIELDPKDESPHNGLGNVYRDQGKYEDAIAEFKRAIELDPNDESPHNGLGNVYRDQGKYEDAIVEFKRAIELDPKDESPHNGLGIVYRDQGKYEDAIAEFKRAIELDPKYASPHNGLGIVYRDQGKYEDAIVEFKRAIELDPKYASPHNGLGIVYRDQGKYEDAIAEFKRAIELDPKDESPHNGLGIVYRDQGKYEDAIAEFKRAIELDPKDASPHNGLGIVYRDQGKYEDAIVEFKRAIELDPNDATPHNNLAELYIRHKRLEDASVELVEAIRLSGETYARVFNYGLVYAMEGNVNEATRLWQKALMLCYGRDLSDKMRNAFLTLLAGESDNGLTYLIEIITNNRPGVGLLIDLLIDVEAVAQCPNPPSGIQRMLVVLQAAINEHAN